LKNVVFLFDFMHLMTVDKVGTMIYQHSRSDNYRDQRPRWLPHLGL